MMRNPRGKTTRKLTDKHDKAVAPLIEWAIDNGEFTEEEQRILKENGKFHGPRKVDNSFLGRASAY